MGSVTRQLLADASCSLILYQRNIVREVCNPAFYVFGDGKNNTEEYALLRNRARAIQMGFKMKVIRHHEGASRSSGWPVATIQQDKTKQAKASTFAPSMIKKL